MPGPEVEVPRITREKRSVVTDTVELPAVYMAWVVDNNFDEDAHGSLAARMLGGGKASRLYRDLVHDLQIAQSVTAEQRTLTHGSVFQIAATAKPGHTAEELETAIGMVLDRMAEDGPGDEELRAAKVSTLAVTVKSLEPSDAVADRLNAYNHYFGDPDQLQRDLDRFDDAGGRDIRRFVAAKLAHDRRVVVHVNPGPKQLPPIRRRYRRPRWLIRILAPSRRNRGEAGPPVLPTPPRPGCRFPISLSWRTAWAYT